MRVQDEFKARRDSRRQRRKDQAGLERFYVGEGTGNPRGKLTVAVVVPASGRGQIKEVFLDGRPE